MIIHGDCLEKLKTLPDNSIDSLVTDPPAGISFMGKAWDDDKGGRDEWIAWLASVMRECHRVMKPGAHGLVWAIPRTSHWTGMALESAGFEVRERISHVFGQGFPKSLDISKSIDKQAGAEREKKAMKQIEGDRMIAQTIHAECLNCGKRQFSGNPCKCPDPSKLAITDDAKTWAGWGTALKPAMEDWWLIRKPISEKNVAQNVLKHGTGGINIDGSRIDGGPRQTMEAGFIRNGRTDEEVFGTGYGRPKAQSVTTQGRFPSNFVLSHTPFCTDEICDIECAIKGLDEQSGISKPHGKPAQTSSMGGVFGNGKAAGSLNQYTDRGGASRFFYCAKISTSERNAGLEGLEKRVASVGNLEMTGRDPSNPNNYKGGQKARVAKGLPPSEPRANTHPTVKPQKLMRYLINLITPPNGVVLDPFAGSGSTGVAAQALGFGFIGIEREAEYVAIAERRVGAAV